MHSLIVIHTPTKHANNICSGIKTEKCIRYTRVHITTRSFIQQVIRRLRLLLLLLLPLVQWKQYMCTHARLFIYSFHLLASPSRDIKAFLAIPHTVTLLVYWLRCWLSVPYSNLRVVCLCMHPIRNVLCTASVRRIEMLLLLVFLRFSFISIIRSRFGVLFLFAACGSYTFVWCVFRRNACFRSASLHSFRRKIFNRNIEIAFKEKIIFHKFFSFQLPNPWSKRIGLKMAKFQINWITRSFVYMFVLREGRTYAKYYKRGDSHVHCIYVTRTIHR